MESSEASLDEKLDSRVTTYRQLGFADDLMVRQLITARFPPALLRARFPNVPEALFASLTPPSPPAITRSTQLSHPVAVARLTDEALTVLQARASTQALSATAGLRSLSGPMDGEDLSFQYTPLIQCSLPHSDPGGQSVFTRRNGWLEVSLSTTRPDRVGLPFGVPARLLSIYIFSEAIRTRSPDICLGRSIHDFLRLIDVPISRGERGSLRMYSDQLLRFVYCAVTILEQLNDSRGRKGLDIKNRFFVDHAQLWWDGEPGVVDQAMVRLSDDIFQSVLERSAPLSTEALKCLRKSPMELDVYAWLVHRLFQLRRPSMVTWQQLSDQIGHTYGSLRDFRTAFSEALQRVVTKTYRDAKVDVTDRGVYLKPSRPHIAPALHKGYSADR